MRRLVTACVGFAVIVASGREVHSQAPVNPADPSVIVQSQEKQSAALAAAWLASSDARTCAWGAYLALRDQRHELLPRLIGLAEAYVVKAGPRSSAEHMDHVAMVGVLDAVIQMGGRISEAAAGRMYPEFPAQSVIFLARGTPQTSASYFLNIFRKDNNRNGEWLAAGNFLRNLKASGFAAAVLEDWTVNAQIRVVDKGSGPVAKGGIAGSCIGGVPSSDKDWPPVGTYYAAGGGGVSSYGGGISAVFGGADPVVYVRTLGWADSQGFNDNCGSWNTNRNMYREHFLAGLAAESAESPTVRSSVSGTITWQNGTQYLKDLRAFVDHQQRLFDTLGKKLIAAGLLESGEWASSRPSLEVRISDERSSKPSSLPTLQNAGTNVKMMN